jgi:hypothetical protein
VSLKESVPEGNRGVHAILANNPGMEPYLSARMSILEQLVRARVAGDLSFSAASPAGRILADSLRWRDADMDIQVSAAPGIEVVGHHLEARFSIRGFIDT